jgi:Tol biopolymer transport system component
VLAYRIGERVIDDRAGRALWIRRDGQVLAPVGTLGGPISALALSPDERRLVLQRRYGTDFMETDLWMLDLADGGREWTFTLSRDVPAFAGGNMGAVWSPDGTYVAYTAGRNIHIKDSSGAGAARDLGVEGFPLDWTDGYLVYSNYASTLGELDLFVLPMEDPSAAASARALISGPGIDALAAVSPNGRWIAYASARGSNSGDVEVYVRRFRPDGADEASDTVLRISRDGGFSPKWRADGKELFYAAGGGGLLAVEIDQDADVPRPGNPVMLFTLGSNNWDVSHDGQRFIVSSFFGGDSEPDTPINVVLNWEAALAR